MWRGKQGLYVVGTVRSPKSEHLGAKSVVCSLALVAPTDFRKEGATVRSDGHWWYLDTCRGTYYEYMFGL